MPNVPAFCVYCTILASFACSTTLQAQDTTFQKYLKVATTVQAADNGQLFTVDIGIKNPSSIMLAGRIRIMTDEELELISRQEIKVSVNPGESFFTSANIHVPITTRAADELRTLVMLTDSTGTVLDSQYVYVSVNSTRNVTMYMLKTNIQIEKGNDTIAIPVRLHNLGNTDQQIRLLAKFPSNIDERGYINNEYTVPAFTDTVTEIYVHVTKAIIKAGRFSVSITATYADGDIAGISSVEIQSLRTKKRYDDRQSLPLYDRYSTQQHILDFSAQYLFTQFEAYEVVGGSNILFNKSLVTYNVDAQVWRHQNSPLYLRNTYIDIQKNNTGVTAGNISRNFDITLTGRGIAAYRLDTARKIYYEAGLMDENYNLAAKNTNSDGTSSSIGKAAWGKFTINKRDWGLGTEAVHEKNNLLKEDDYQLSNEQWWQANKQLHFTIKEGVAYTQSQASDTSKLSGAVRIRMEGKWERFIFNSDNFYSTPYYPGLRRGESNLDERAALLTKRFTYSVGYSHYEFKPQYLLPENNISSHIHTDRGEIGIAGHITNNIGFGFSPVYYHEINEFPGSNRLLSTEISSIGGAIQLNYFNTEQQQYLYLNGEIGGYNAPLVTDNGEHTHMKLSLTGKVNWFSLSMYGQIGEFYAADVMSRYLQNADYTRSITITPMAQKKFLDNRLRGEIGFSFNKSNITLSGIQLLSRVEYSLPNKDVVYTSIRLYKYEYPGTGINDLRIGYQKNLPVARVTTDRKPLHIFVYKDNNNNEKFDKGDTIATNTVVSINGDLLITDGNGNIQYKGLPIGEYTVYAPSSKGWDAPEQVVGIKGKTNISLPLRRSSILTGSIIYAEQEAVVYEVAKNKEQIVVYATATNGTIYTTKTDETGGFIFFIPPGTYDVEIQPDALPDKVDCSDCKQVVALPQHGTASTTFHFSVKERVFHIQKFTSPNTKNH